MDVILKTYQRPWLLGVCLQSVRAHWGGSVRVIVADDGTDPVLWREAMHAYGHLADEWIHSEVGEAKWSLCRAGRFSDVVPTCGATWNDAAAACRGDSVFLVEDDSRISRDFAPASATALLATRADALCLIGMRVRCNMDIGGEPVRTGGEDFLLRHHETWPWSFDGVFYRRSDWDRIGPWPTGIATGPMEHFVQTRLRELGWIGRPYATTADPCCDVDSQSSCRTDHPSTYMGRFRHVDAINAAWFDGSFRPTYEQVRVGAAPWIRSDASFGAGIHYPAHLRQTNFVTGFELKHDAADHDAYWIAYTNAIRARYGEPLVTEVPEPCKSKRR